MPRFISRFFLRFVCFLIMAGLLLFYLEGMLFRRDGVCMPFYAEPENSIDVVFLGSSLSNAAVSPTALYGEKGFTSYVLYNWSQTPWAAYYYAREALKTQSPRVLVVETNMFLYGTQSREITDGINTTSGANALSIPLSGNRAALALAMHRWQTDHPSLTSLCSLYRNHANWKGFSPGDLLWFAQKTPAVSNKGYGPLYVTESFACCAAPAQQAAGEPGLYEGSRVYLEKLFRLSRSRQISLVFLTYPDADYTGEDYARLAALAEFCAGQGAAVLDLTRADLQSEIGFDPAANMADHAHVNYLGAEKITGLLAQRLAAGGYDLPDHRGDENYSSWDAAAEQDRRDDQDMRVKIAVELPDLLACAADGRYLTLVYASGDMTAADPGALRGVFAQLGMDSSVFDRTAAASLWVWQNGAGAEASAFTLQTEAGLLEASPGSVTVGGVEQSYNRPGINVVVLERQTGRLIQCITWSTLHDYSAFTR